MEHIAKVDQVACANDCNDEGQHTNEIEEIVEEVGALGLNLAVCGLGHEFLTLALNSFSRLLGLVLSVGRSLRRDIFVVESIVSVIIIISDWLVIILKLLRDSSKVTIVVSHFKLDALEVFDVARRGIFVEDSLVIFVAATSVDPAVSVLVGVARELHQDAHLLHDLVLVASVSSIHIKAVSARRISLDCILSPDVEV